MRDASTIFESHILYYFTFLNIFNLSFHIDKTKYMEVQESQYIK